METRTFPGWVGLIAGAAVAGLAVAIGYAPELTYLMDVHPGVAGWVQAVGSIAAIAAAIWIERGTTRREAAVRRRGARAKLAAASRIVTMFRIKCEALLNGRLDPRRRDSRFGGPVIQGFRSLSETLKNFPISDLPDPRAVGSFVDALQAAELIVTFLEECDATTRTIDPAEPRRLLDHQIKFLTEFTGRVRTADDELRGYAAL